MSRTCTFESLDLLDPSYAAAPYEVLARARSEQPVFFAEKFGFWVITRFDHVKSVLKDPATFSSVNAQWPVQEYCAEAKAVLQQGGFGAVPSLTSLDPPAHTRLRAHYGSVAAFMPGRIAALGDWVRAQVDGLIDGFIARGSADLVKELTAALPPRVVYRLVGFPDEDVARLHAWCVDRLRLNWARPDPAEQVEIARRLVAFWQYTEGFVAQRLQNPRDDYASDLVRIHQQDPQALALNELTSFVYGLTVAGQETTVNSMGSMLRLLLGERTQWERFVREPGLAKNAVEETLRLEPPICAWRRITTRDTELGGITLPKGSQLLVHLGSAGHDSSRFPEGEKLDVARKNAASHLAFGAGIHYCLGNALARLESTIVLETLLRRMPDLTLAPEQSFDYRPLLSFRGPSAVLAEWTPASA